MGEQTRAAGIQKLQAHLKNRNTIIHPVWSVGHLDCKDNGFLVFPDLTPSHDKQRSPILSHGSMTGLQEAPCSPNKWPQLSKTQPDPFLPELSRSSALAAALCFCFTLKKKKKKTARSFHKTWKLNWNPLQILSSFTLNLLVLNLLGRMQPIIPYQMLPCLKSTAITFNFVRAYVLWSCINS